MGEARLEERNLRCDELQFQQQAGDDIQLGKEKPRPHPEARTSSAWREKRPQREDRQKRRGVQQVECDCLSSVMADETNCRADSPQCAAPVFHDDSNLRVVDHEIDGDNESAKKKIEQRTNEKDSAFDI